MKIMPCMLAEPRSPELCCAALLALAAPIAVAAEPADRAALEMQLKEARARLNDAARDVADLSQQLYGGDRQEELMRFVRAATRRHARINIEDAKGATTASRSWA